MQATAGAATGANAIAGPANADPEAAAKKAEKEERKKRKEERKLEKQAKKEKRQFVALPERCEYDAKELETEFGMDEVLWDECVGTFWKTN